MERQASQRRRAAVGIVAAGTFAFLDGAQAQDNPAEALELPTVEVIGTTLLPGLGTLYVDPATLPVGPFLGYNHKGKLVNITYMVPLKDIDGHKNFETLGTVAAGVKLNHTDIQYNPGHPGVEEPHYHIVQWLISPAAVKAEMQ